MARGDGPAEDETFNGDTVFVGTPKGLLIECCPVASVDDHVEDVGDPAENEIFDGDTVFVGTPKDLFMGECRGSGMGDPVGDEPSDCDLEAESRHLFRTC